jgi:hypothetical protein
MTPAPQQKPGAMADAALNNVGTVLETLSQSPFPWNRIQFRVFGQAGAAVQYQLTYARDEISALDFERIHINSLRYPPLHPADLRVGITGILLDVKIIDIVDENNMIVWLDESNSGIDDDDRPAWIRGISTLGKVDDTNCDILTPLMVTKTVRYRTAGGASKTVYMLEPTGSDQNLVVGDYYSNEKLIALAQNIWLNSSIDRFQGRPAIADSYISRPGFKPPALVNTLQIGGYVREDGTACPLTVVHTPHLAEAAEPNTPENRTGPIPAGYRSDNPLVTSSPPQSGF